MLPPTTLDLPAERESPAAAVEHDFTGPTLPDDFQWLRTPYPERIVHNDRQRAAPDRARKPWVVVRAGAGRAAAG